MSSITTWTRLEPRARGTDLLPSLEGRVFDPAWLLGRQWQVGEFNGEDAGTPAVAAIDLDIAPITAYQAANGAPVVVGNTPIECLAGPEPAQPRTAAEAARAGAELLVQLRAGGMSAAGLASVVGSGLDCADAGPVSSVGASFLGLISGRLPDIGALEAGLVQAAATGTAPAGLGLSPADAAAYVTAARGFLGWRDAQQLQADADAWLPERLEHGFQLGVNAAASTGSKSPAIAVGLRATAWAGDELDWYDVDHDPVAPVPQAGPPPARSFSSLNGPLTGLSYPGMPSARWWQFEDAHVAFAQVTADPTDLARMLVVEFACAYSNDWYLRPIELPVGTLTRVLNIRVQNTFGDLIDVPATGTTDWCVFRNTSLNSGSAHLDGLLLWPALADPVVSEPIENVQFARDERANLAWALELLVTGQDGAPLDRHAAAATSSDGGGVLTPGPWPASTSGALQYQLASTVPEYWFPMPVDENAHFDLRLLQRADADGNPHDVFPAGRLLAAGAAFSVWQEEIPREGTQVVRERKLARDLSWRPVAWTSRRTSAGRGPTSSALRYDQVEAPELGSSS